MTLRSIRVASKEEWQNASEWLKNRSRSSQDVEAKVRDILTNVETRGDAALIEYTKNFDCQSFAPPPPHF